MFAPHYRLTCSGTFGNGDDGWTFGVAINQYEAGLQDQPNGLPGTDVTDNWRDACVALVTGPNSPIRGHAAINRVKVAAIDENGHYRVPPREYVVVGNGGYGNNGTVYPWQVALAVTLETDGDLGRIKGRIYLPAPGMGLNPSDDLIGADTAEAARNAVVTWINQLADEPGLDNGDFRVCVASQGRHSKSGVLTVPPGNHDVQRVSVGRRLDIQRRRANSVRELRVASVDVDQV